VFVWADTENTEERFLGGLNMGERLFNWHPVFMVWGTTCLLEGAVAFRSMHFYPHGVKKRMHALWNLLGSVLLSAGLAVVFKYKHENHIASLYSTHSWLGIFTSTLVFAQVPDYIHVCVTIRYRHTHLLLSPVLEGHLQMQMRPLLDVCARP